MIKIDVKLPDIASKLSSEKIDTLLKSLAQRVRTRMIQSTPVDTALAKKSYTQPRFEKIDETFPVGRQSRGISFGNVQPYAHILETGSRKGRRPWPNVGPKTVEIDGQIYSSQAPGGMIESGQIERLVEKALPDLVEKLLKDD